MITAVLFDVDGVLLDSMLSNAEWFREILGHFGFVGPRDDEMYEYFSLPSDDIVRKFALNADEKKIEEILEYGFSIASSKVDQLMRVPEHALDVVQKLSRKYKLGLVTSRRKDFMNEVYSRYPQDLFPTVVTIEETKKHKPDPEPLLLAAEELNVPPEQCVYIGDMPSDVEAGHAAGMKVIIYSKVTVPGADKQTEDFSEIPNLIKLLD